MSKRQKIALVVDDEESVLYVLSHQLKRLGYESVAVSNGQEVLEELARQEFDLVILDVRMPGMSGLEVLRRMRPHHPGTCIVMLSAVVDETIAATALNLGADSYIMKPFGPDYLRVRLQAAQKQRELARRGETGQLPDKEAAQKEVSLAEVTKDLIRRQGALLKRLTSPPTPRAKNDK